MGLSHLQREQKLILKKVLQQLSVLMAAARVIFLMLFAGFSANKAQNICVVRILKARSEGDGQVIAEQKALNGKNQTVVNSAELSLNEAQIDKLIEDIKMFVPKEKF